MIAEFVERQVEPADEGGVKLRFDGADRQILAVGAFVTAIKISRTIEDIVRAPVAPEPHRSPSMYLGGEQRRTVDHRGVDHLPLAALPALDQRGEDSGHDEGRAAAEISKEIDRREWGLASLADQAQRARHGDIIDVVPGLVGQRAVLPPASHSRVNQSRVRCAQFPRSESEPFHHARPKAFEHDVGARAQRVCNGGIVGNFEIERDRAAAAVEHVERRIARGHLGPAGAIDADYVRPHVGQHHCCERGWPNTRELDDPDLSKRPRAHCVSPFLSPSQQSQRINIGKSTALTSAAGVKRLVTR